MPSFDQNTANHFVGSQVPRPQATERKAKEEKKRASGALLNRRPLVWSFVSYRLDETSGDTFNRRISTCCGIHWLEFHYLVSDLFVQWFHTVLQNWSGTAFDECVECLLTKSPSGFFTLHEKLLAERIDVNCLKTIIQDRHDVQLVLSPIAECYEIQNHFERVNNSFSKIIILLRKT